MKLQSIMYIYIDVFYCSLFYNYNFSNDKNR